MPSTPIPIPKGFRRLNNFPLDQSSIFTSFESLETYASTNATAYPGQCCAVVLGEEVSLYVLNADKVPVIASGAGGSTAVAKYLEARQKILTGENAQVTTLQLSETLESNSLWHRPRAENLPSGRGWLSSVSGVQVKTSILGETITEPLTGADYVFQKDRQCFYFLDKNSTGVVKYSGAASRNFLEFVVDVEKNITSPSSETSTLIATNAETFQITSASVTSQDKGVESIPDFYFDKLSSTIFFETKFTTTQAYFNVQRVSAPSYYISRDQVVLGPYTDQSIKNLYNANVLVASDYYYNGGWLLMADFPFDQVGTTTTTTDLGFFTAAQILANLQSGNLVETDYFHNGEDWELLSEFTAPETQNVKGLFKTNTNEEIEIIFEGLNNESRISIPKITWNSLSIKIDGVNFTEFSLNDNTIVFNNSISEKKFIEIKSGPKTYKKYNFTGGLLALPTSLESCISVVARFEPSKFYNIPGFVLEKKPNLQDDILHLGWGYPTGQKIGTFTINAQNNAGDKFKFTFSNTPSNVIELPTDIDNVFSVSLNDLQKLVVFDYTQQKIYFPKTKNGVLLYTATHKAYEGLAAGGEEIEIIEEIPGVFATTAGTGHSISTLRSMTPSRDFYSYWLTKDRKLVQIVDDNSVVIYQDENENALFNSRPGYTADEIKPVTVKLPLSALYSMARRSDESFFQVAFTPNFVSTKFNSATYPDLDDTQRYAADSMASGKTVTLSTNKTVPVRGVQGVNFQGPKPTYYAGKTLPKITIATYKWFIVKCKNRNGNAKLENGKEYLLCVNNVHYDTLAIMLNISEKGYNVAADLFSI